MNSNRPSHKSSATPGKKTAHRQSPTTVKKTTPRPSPSAGKKTFDFMPIDSVEGATLQDKIRTVLRRVRDLNRIVVLDIYLRPDEQKDLLLETMHAIGEDFTGIDFHSVSTEHAKFFEDMVERILKKRAKRRGFTIVGPNSFIEEIRQDPGKAIFHVSVRG